ncbi:MAG TPA: endolytic transglycosylase MltG [Candidatus Limnocylindrales bacterium]|nr:endolytic transglycosylase MltG [Candidatus Limnocylindrales bacterium]
MTIRSGGRPRDTRQAHPIESQAHDEPWEPDYRRDRGGYGYDNGLGNGRNGRNRRGSGGGMGGIARFLAFALILAAVVLVAFVTVLRPLVTNAVVGWASDSPGALGIDFVADMVKEDLGDKLTTAASTDTEQVPFQVGSGEDASTIAARLEEQGFLDDRRAFVLIAVEEGLTDQLKSGDFILRKSMTPEELVTALLDPPANPYVDIDLRTGLRLEQVTAKLQTVDGLSMNPQDFYELAKHPTPELLADYPWVDIPEGASLEGYLWPATYRVLPDTTGQELVRLMLDRFDDAIGDRMNVPEARGLSWYEVLTLASLVEKEAILDEEKPHIAGVYQNRLDGKNGHQLLQADPSVIYANDTVELGKLDFMEWQTYTFGTVPEGVALADVPLPPELEGYNTYRNGGLPPGPLATPTLSSIDAALTPDTAEGFVFFLAKNDGSQGHAFAKTLEEHEANLREYGYR